MSKINNLQNWQGWQFWTILLTIFLFLSSFQTAQGQTYRDRQGDSITPNFYISAGYYYPRLSTRLRVDGSRGLGSDITLENDFKLNDELGVFRIDGIFRLSKG